MVANVCDICGKRIRENASCIEYKEITYSNLDCFSVRNESMTKHICASCKNKCMRSLVKDGIIKRFSLFFKK